tara:strand:+ start:214 stop:447 length:234 start_codon:yes stop_codon:yes gene_type:complete
MAGMKRTGQPGGTCKVLAKGDKRRLADGRNAFRKMDAEQREEFVAWMLENGLVETLQGNEERFLDRVLDAAYPRASK